MPSLPVTIRLRGRFSLTDADGGDITPRPRKERGLLALLAAAPDKRCTRSGIIDKLWSTRGPEQASASLRRALSNLRRDLGPAAEILAADRFDVWLTEAAVIDAGQDDGPEAELLVGVDVPDPEFEDWLRDLRQSDQAGQSQRSAPLSRPTPQTDGGTLIVLSPPEDMASPEERFLVAFLLDMISGRCTAMGGAEVHVGAQPSPDRLAQADAIFWVEVSSTVLGEAWHVRVRAHADLNRRFLWSGGTVLPMDLRRICEGTDISAFVSTALTGILSRSTLVQRAENSTFIQLQRAAARLFTGSQQDLHHAETELARLCDSESAPVALAWRAFACLTRVLEFRGDQRASLDEAQSYLRDALARDPSNQIALSIASSIELKFNGDRDLGFFLAQQALHHGENDPYALDAMAQAEKLIGNASAAYQMALRGHKVAKDLPNAFFWDMEVCLTAISMGEVDVARQAALAAHLKNPSYRPALRYLCALNLLADDMTAAYRASDKLKLIEPGFSLSAIHDPDYPLHTLRQSGVLSAPPTPCHCKPVAAPYPASVA